ncbi:hypothetical protein [Paracoccus mutanolyticus]|nr:hypothetical protein [Paracoccus mutanolyticus]
MSRSAISVLQNPDFDVVLRAAPDPGLNGRSLHWPRGKVLGGSRR